MVGSYLETNVDRAEVRKGVDSPDGSAASYINDESDNFL
jgi:hypothetical protein